MPRLDGTGPRGSGPRTGRGMGICPTGIAPRVGAPRRGSGRGLGGIRGRIGNVGISR
jgi:hypothetical protein